MGEKRTFTCKIYYLFVSWYKLWVPETCHIFCELLSWGNLFLLDLHYQTGQEAVQQQRDLRFCNNQQTLTTATAKNQRFPKLALTGSYIYGN